MPTTRRRQNVNRAQVVANVVSVGCSPACVLVPMLARVVQPRQLAAAIAAAATGGPQLRFSIAAYSSQADLRGADFTQARGGL